MCPSLISVSFSTSRQQFVRRKLLLAQLAHDAGGNDRTLRDRRERAEMTVMVGPLFKKGRILEEEKGSQPERAEGRVHPNGGTGKWSNVEKASKREPVGTPLIWVLAGAARGGAGQDEG